MRRQFFMTGDKIWIPIACKKQTKKLSVYRNERQLYELQIPAGEIGAKGYACDYYAPVPLADCMGSTVILEGDFPEEFFLGIKFREEPPVQERRPALHFTANTGWVNDPNGLVYADGIYHLFFQYNPFDSEWSNMSWGHAVSRDLLHWEQWETVLYPDENGTMFSGCGLKNEKGLLGLDRDTLLFFYSAAGGTNEWSGGKEFTQRIAYSTDGGKTLCKTNRGVLPTIKKENRDPKIFWHCESEAYIMSLWLEGNTFAILRSADLEQWKTVQAIELEDAWECPDLLRFTFEDGSEKWIFWSADGYYFPGDFDGWQFVPDKTRGRAYANDLAYAAQTWSGVDDRIISIPWLRTKNAGKCYKGSFGLPREFSLIKEDNTYILCQKPVREWTQAKKKVLHKTGFKAGGRVICLAEPETAYEINVVFQSNSEVYWSLSGSSLSYNPVTGVLKFESREIIFPQKLTQLSVIADADILEISDEKGAALAYFEVENKEKQAELKEIGIFGEELDEVLIFAVK